MPKATPHHLAVPLTQVHAIQALAVVVQVVQWWCWRGNAGGIANGDGCSSSTGRIEGYEAHQ